MTTTTTSKKTTTGSREQLPEAVEKKMLDAITKEFAAESETFRAGAVIWSRKQLKFERGIRSTKPPIPAGLQHTSNRAKTQATIERVAKAIGANLDHGSKTAAKAAETVASVVVDGASDGAVEAPQVSPDPKPTGRKRGAKKEEAAVVAAA